MVIIGFTGTQKGMTSRQGHTFYELLKEHGPTEFHHGDCIGADEHAHKIVDGLFDAKIIIHPPEHQNKRAFCESDNIEEPLPYLERNKNIVNACEILFATPQEKEEVLRSGTWSTIRYARKSNKRIFTIFPDGTYEEWAYA